MPEREFTPQAAPTERPTLLWWEKVGMVIVVAFLVVLGLVWGRTTEVHDTQTEIRTAQEEGKIRGLKNRAIDCEQSIAMGVPMGPEHPCNDAEVLEFYDPEALRAALAANREGTVAAIDMVPSIRAMTCRLLGLHGRNDPECTAEETG